MKRMLSPGQGFTVGAAQGTVRDFIGDGGQGEVYRAELAGQEVALKWYHSHAATPYQRGVLDDLVQRGAPDSRFLWPEGVALSEGAPDFGYVMRLRPPRYVGVLDLLLARTAPTFRALATAGYELADGYFRLHTQGLCYRDISHGNAFFDPQTGEVLICDNDNVSVDGAEKAVVNGTPRYMAPEVVRREADASADTDLYSLGVLLFYMFFVHHPLEGAQELAIRCMDEAGMRKLYGTHPVFIFDPENGSNRPVPGVHDNADAFWNVYPNEFKRHFVRHFVLGLNDPKRRVRENEWREAMVSLRDSVFYCACGKENFYDRERVAEGPGRCWACTAELRPPPRFRVSGRNVVMLNPDTRLYPHHVRAGGQHLYDFSAEVAEIVRHPQRGDWGLKNTSQQRWVLTNPEGSMSDVEPGQTARLVQGLRVNFGGAEAEIRA